MLNKLINKYSHVNWALADQAMVSGVNFFTSILFARFLGMEAFGNFTLAWMIILFVNNLQTAIIISPMMSIAPKQNDTDKSKYYGAMIIHQIIFSLFSFILIYIFVKISFNIFTEWNIDTLIWPLAFTALACQFQEFMRKLFFSQGKMSLAFLSDFISYIGQIIVILVIVDSSDINTNKVLWIIFYTSSISVFICCFFIKKIIFSYSFFVKILIKHWVFSRWLIVTAILQWLSGNMLLVISGSILGPLSVGVIKSVQNISNALNPLIASMESYLPRHYSLIVKLDNKKLISSVLDTIIKWSILLIPIILVISFFSNFILTTLYNDNLMGYENLLIITMMTTYVGFIGTPVGIALRSMEKTHTLFLSTLISTVFSFIFILSFDKAWGIYGVVTGILLAKIILIISILISFYYYLIHINNYENINFSRKN